MQFDEIAEINARVCVQKLSILIWNECNKWILSTFKELFVIFNQLKKKRGITW